MREHLAPLAITRRGWTYKTDIVTALKAEPQDPLVGPYTLAERATFVTQNLLLLPNCDDTLRDLCAKLNDAAKFGDSLEEEYGDKVPREQVIAGFNVFLERIYDWADEQRVWLGMDVVEGRAPDQLVVPEAG